MDGDEERRLTLEEEEEEDDDDALFLSDEKREDTLLARGSNGNAPLVSGLPEEERALVREKKRLVKERSLMGLSSRMTLIADDPASWFPDVRLLLGPDRVPTPAHRVLLAAASPVLRALLLSCPPARVTPGVAEGELQQLPVLELPEVEPTAFRLLLRFVYAGSLPRGGLSAELGLKLLDLAEHFEIPDLAALCLDVRHTMPADVR